MAYDRDDPRDRPRNERARWRDESRPDARNGSGQGGSRNEGQDRPNNDDRGFLERAGDEIASWFGDDDAERRRRTDQSREQRAGAGPGDASGNRSRDYGRDYERDRNRSGPSRDWNNEQSAFSRESSGQRTYDQGRDDNWDRDRSRGPGRYQDWNDNRGMFARGGSSERDYNPRWRDEYSPPEFDRGQADREVDRGWTDRYQPVTGDYGRSGRAPQPGDQEDRSHSKWAEDEYRGTSRAGSANWSDKSRVDRSDRSRNDRFDPHYHSWRDRHLSELDRDYDDFRAEHQSRFESDFGSWRERRQQKRGLLTQLREHMEVLGSDKKHVGTIDKTAGDRLILTKSDPESGGIHHSISCSEIERIDDDRVILNCTAEEARQRWRDESRGRALFEQDDQGEAGPRALDRSFGGTYDKR